MKTISIAALLVVIAMASGNETRQYDLNNAKELFETFIKDHNKEYKDDADKELHYQAFVTNLREINRLNELNPSATYGINKFADYTDDDKKMMRGLKRDPK